MLRFSVVLVIITVTSIFTSIIYAQDLVENGGSINGEVIEVSEEQNPIEGVEVEIVEVNTNKSYTTLTDKNGKYSVSELPAGRYMVKLSKKGFGNRTGRSKVLAAGGEIYDRIKMVRKNNFQPNQRKIDLMEIESLKKIEPIIQRVSEILEMQYKLDKQISNELKQSILDTVRTELEKEDENVNSTLRDIPTDKYSYIKRLLSHPNTKAIFSKHLTETQLQNYINYINHRLEHRFHAGSRYTAAFLDQALSLTSEQRETIIKLIIESKPKDMDFELIQILSYTLQRTGANILEGELSEFLKDILTEDQLKISQGWIELVDDNIPDMVDLVQIDPNQPEAIKEIQTVKQDFITETQKRRMLNLTQAVLIAHRTQFGTLNDQQRQRLDLIAKGIGQEYIDKQIMYANDRILALETINQLMALVMMENIDRQNAIEKSIKLQSDVWDKTNMQEKENRKSDYTQHELFRHILKDVFFARINEIINQKLYQNAIKEVLSEQAYTQYNKHNSERHTFQQQAVQVLIVEFYDMLLILDDKQREHFEKTVSKLTLHEMSNVGAQFMLLECYLNINPEILSPWQINVLKSGGI